MTIVMGECNEYTVAIKADTIITGIRAPSEEKACEKVEDAIATGHLGPPTATATLEESGD